MRRENIEKALNRKPFRPFFIRLTDGELVPIEEEHRAAIHPFAETIIIFEAKGGCGLWIFRSLLNCKQIDSVMM